MIMSDHSLQENLSENLMPGEIEGLLAGISVQTATKTMVVFLLLKFPLIWLDYETKSNSTYMNLSIEKPLIDWLSKLTNLNLQYMKEDNVSQLGDYHKMTIHSVKNNECMGFSYIYLFKFKSFGQLLPPPPPSPPPAKKENLLQFLVFTQ